MGITALSEETVRLLGSPTVIATPVDLVKELLDNAIDAEATSVEILVAPNLVDKLEVRDNGHGIRQEDYEFLGRPSHTSKITCFEMIPSLGGATLGFRGQALASANSLGNVCITTRTAQDVTATLLKLRAGVGGLDSSQRKSAPVGTTVSVTDLYKKMPVRARVATKEALKNIVKIKQLLQGYALARPGLRLSFKSLGSNTKWSYTPRPQATVKEAVIQVFGTEVMSQCMIRTVCNSQAETDVGTTHDIERLSIEAVLPSADGSQSKASKGAFFAVDSRPQTAADGTMKKLFKIFKAHFTRALSETNVNSCPKDPFLCVHIKCSPGAYDPNVEPSKTRVLFANESHLTDLFERLCTEVYRTQQNADTFVTVERRQLHSLHTQTPPRSGSGRQEIAQRDLQTSSPISQREPHIDDANASVARGTCLNRTSRLEEPHGSSAVSAKRLPVASNSDLATASNAHKVPITPHVRPRQEYLRLDAFTRAPNESSEAELPIPELRGKAHGTVITAHDFAGHRPVDVAHELNIQRDEDISSDEEAERLASLFRGQPDAHIRAQDYAGPVNPSASVRIPSSMKHAEGGVAAFEGDVLNQRRRHTPPVGPIFEGLFDDLPILRPYDDLFEISQPARIAQTTHQPQNSAFASPNVPDYNVGTYPAPDIMQQMQSPAGSNDGPGLSNFGSWCENHGDRMDPDRLIQTKISFGARRLALRSPPQQTPLHIDDVPARANPPYRKPWKGNNAQNKPKALRKFQKAEQCAFDQPVNHQVGNQRISEPRSVNYRHPARSESHISPRLEDHPTESSITHLPSPPDNNFETDARKYLMRRQRSEADHKKRGQPLLQRAKSELLPMERIPDACEMQCLVLVMTPDMGQLRYVARNPAKDIALEDDFSAEAILGQNMDLKDAADIETRLRVLVDEWSRRTLGQETVTEINIGALVKGKTATA